MEHEQAMQSVDKCQAGCTVDMSTADQTLLVRAAVDHSKCLEQPLFVTIYDYSESFDSLWPSDCLLSLIKVGVEKEVVSILRTLNDTCKVVIKTLAGLRGELKMSSVVQ